MNPTDSAFPTTISYPNPAKGFREHFGPERGLTLRQYFAAHAPAEPQEWFSPVFAEQMPDADPKWQRCEACKTDSGLCMHTADCAKLDKVLDECREWRDRRYRAKRAQWPWAWADAVLASSLDNSTATVTVAGAKQNT